MAWQFGYPVTKTYGQEGLAGGIQNDAGAGDLETSP